MLGELPALMTVCAEQHCCSWEWVIFVHCSSHKITKTRKDTAWTRWLDSSVLLYRLVNYNYTFPVNLKSLPGHLIGCDKKSEIVRYFLGRLCDEIGLLCDKLCNLFRANLHCFIRFQRRKTTWMLFYGQFECKGIIKHLFKTK